MEKIIKEGNEMERKMEGNEELVIAVEQQEGDLMKMNAQERLKYCLYHPEALVEWIRKNAQDGDAEAQWLIGEHYADGDLVPQSWEEAVTWYRKSAEQGYAKAQAILGYCYSQGMGVSRNDEEAVKWFHEAAEQGCAVSQYNLACCYAEGIGISQNWEEAVTWFWKAAEQGDPEAAECLKVLGADV